MAILNRESDGLVSVLVAIVRASIAIGPTSKTKLLDIVSPLSIDDGKNDQKKARNTLNRWFELGLYIETEKGEWRLEEECRSQIKKLGATPAVIAHVARQIVLTSRNNRNFWSDTENKSADFTRAAAWMLAQDVHLFIPTSHSVVEKLCNDQAPPDVILLQNDTRWAGYVSWATFLGFGRSDTGKASGGFITDVTPVVRFHLHDVLPKRGEVAIDDFIGSLASAIPVLDGGSYRTEVESKLKPEKWKRSKEGELSTSLSRALLRLRESGDLRFESRSDAGRQMKLIGREGRVVESITHVRRGDAK
jgi:hypothetical protein